MWNSVTAASVQQPQPSGSSSIEPFPDSSGPEPCDALWKAFDGLSKQFGNTAVAQAAHTMFAFPRPAEEQRREVVIDLTQENEQTHAETRSCPSCVEDLPIEDFPSMPLTSRCNHKLCTDCTRQWIDTQLTDQGWNKITCAECKEAMSYADVKRLASAAIFERYDRLSARSEYSNIPDFRWCTNSGCNSGQIHSGGQDAPLFHCCSCKYRYCSAQSKMDIPAFADELSGLGIIHDLPWHEGETCRAYDRRMQGLEPEEEGEVMDPRTAREFGIQMPDRNPFRKPTPDIARPGPSTASLAQLAADQEQARSLQAHYNGESSSRSSPGPAFVAFPETYDATARSPKRLALGKRRAFDHDQLAADEEQARALQAFFETEGGSSGGYGYGQRTDDWGYSANRATAEHHADDEFVARALHEQFLAEEIERRATQERQRQARADNIRKAEEQAARDAAVAKKLQKQLEQEEKAERKAAKELQKRLEREEKQQLDAQREREKAERKAYQDKMQRRTEEQKGEQTVRQVGKPCPGCGYYIQKNGGCNHMTCSRCHIQFNWE